MACSSCGGVGCGTCNTVGCSTCLPTSSCGVPQPSCTNRCPTTLPATPSPYYLNTPTCQENNCQQIINNYFSAAICVSYAFNIPDCDEPATLYFSNVKSLPVGAFLWHQEYGYLEVVGFNPQSGQVTVVNNCYFGNATPGTNIPACTCFVVTAAPTAIDTSADLQDEVSTTKSGAINGAGASLTTDEIEIVFTNGSASKVMNIVLEVIVNVSWDLTAGVTTLTHAISTNVDASGYTTVLSRANTVELDGSDPMSEQNIYRYTSALAPGGTRNIKVKGVITNTAGTTNVNVTSLITSASGLGVAV